MKKLIALILAVCLFGTLVACGGSTTDNSSTPSGQGSNSGSAVVNVADFAGCWKLQNGSVDTIKIDAATSTVTAYDANGYKISVFPVVATENGIVLKMGTLGNVTLEDATSLTITAEPMVTKQPEIVGKYTYITGDLPDDTALEIKADGKYTLSGSNSDYGPYTYKNMTVSLTPTTNLLWVVDYEVIGGGKILYSEEKGRVFVSNSALSDNSVKAVANQCALMANEWKAEDGSLSVTFDKNGKLLVSGAETAVWYPTATGATVEYTDGQTDYVEIKDGKVTLNYFGKTLAK